MLAVLRKPTILFMNDILREFDNKKMLFYKLKFQFLVVRLICVNAA